MTTCNHECEGHDSKHVHGAKCGHDTIKHDDHVDYVVEGHKHHVHDGHCDDHGKI